VVLRRQETGATHYLTKFSQLCAQQATEADLPCLNIPVSNMKVNEARFWSRAFGVIRKVRFAGRISKAMTEGARR
jgi:hypothetical protein